MEQKRKNRPRKLANGVLCCGFMDKTCTKDFKGPLTMSSSACVSKPFDWSTRQVSVLVLPSLLCVKEICQSFLRPKDMGSMSSMDK